MSYLLSLILLLLPTYLIRLSIFGVPTTLLEILIYIIFIIGFFKARKVGFRKLPLKIILPIGLLIFGLIISIFIAPDRNVALGELKGFFIDPLLVFWLIFQFVKKEDMPKLFIGLILSGLFVASHTIIQKVLGVVTPDGRVIGIFGYSPNYIALFLAPITVLLIAAVFLLDLKKHLYLVIGVWLLVVLNLVAIYFSGSRGGILAIMAGTGVFIIANFWSFIRERLSAKVIISILIIMAIYTSWILFKPNFSASLESGRVVTSNNLRWQIWQTSLELGRNYPLLGVGLGNFQNAFGELTKNRGNFPEYITPMALTPHNIFLMFWLSTGILGLVAFLWLLFVFFEEGLKKIRTNPTAVILVAVMAAIVVYGLIEASIWKNDLSIVFWVFWGLIWAI